MELDQIDIKETLICSHTAAEWQKRGSVLVRLAAVARLIGWCHGQDNPPK